MSWSLNLFIDSANSLEDFSGELGLLLGTDPEFVSGSESPSYRYRSSGCTLILRTGHEMVNDRNMKFEAYPYQLEVLPHRTADWNRDKNQCLQLVQRVFEKLKASNRYSLLLTEKLQKKLDSFDPMR